MYLKSKDANIYSNMDGEVNDMIVTFGFSYASSTKDVRIEFTTNKDFVSYKIYAGNVVLLTLSWFNPVRCSGVLASSSCRSSPGSLADAERRPS